MGTSEPATREFSEIERKIIDCAIKGIAADFGDGESDSKKPKVDASFLSDLWLERLPGIEMHPFGIEVMGLEIDGQLGLGGSRQSSAGKQCLLGFHAHNCFFNDMISLQNVRCESIYFTDCEIASFEQDDGILVSVDGDGMNVDGRVAFSKTVAHGHVSFQGSQISGAAQFDDCTFPEGLSLWGTTIGNQLRVMNSRLATGYDGSALAFPNAQIGGQVFLKRNVVDGLVYAANAQAAEVFIERCRFGSPAALSVNFSSMTLKGDLQITSSRLAEGLSLQSGTIGGNVFLQRSHICNGANLADATVTGGVMLKQSVFTGHMQSWACTIAGLNASTVTIEKAAFDGHVSMQAAHVLATCEISDTIFGRRRSKIFIGPSLPYNLNMQGFSTGYSLQVNRCAFHSINVLSNLEIGGNIWFEQCYFAPEVKNWSIRLAGSKVGAIVGIDACLIGSGLELPTLHCSELQLHGNLIFPGMADLARNEIAIWASECVVSRRVGFAVDQSGPGKGNLGACWGRVDFSTSRIGERFYLRSTRIFLSQATKDDRSALAVDLSRIEVGGDLMIGPSAYKLVESIDQTEREARIEGCVNLDDARIAGDLIVHQSTIAADGDIVRPLSHFETEERVSKRKRGAALTLRDARIDGELELGRPVLRGIVDMRDATVGAIADGGGDRWEDAGVAPGHLLLDGLTYRDLDNVYDGAAEGRSIKNTPSDAASRRLRWLTLQYPDRAATPDTFVPQPYEQLASIFASEGNEKARRQVLIEKRDLQRRHGRLGRFERGVQWVLMAVSEYGYSPGRAILCTIAWLMLGTAGAYILENQGAIILSSIDGQPKAPFSPLVYALDAAIPIIDLNQDSGWTLDKEKLGSRWMAELLVTAKGLYEIIGMLLVSITILTLTGTLREKE
ncbi:hypothetical protein [Parerythrobacter jejuensis]|uniref:Membrane-associated oxidoreductase n=1 Tax=Parerythrobacter jejuensis TaxID=795812 RepID=A0A845APC7_9SPHN|nr:hypothetical protein [Parerythrobacter jejuensis]MXP32692.1 hypothetical protein [Parerythrobacter jejuensis]